MRSLNISLYQIECLVRIVYQVLLIALFGKRLEGVVARDKIRLRIHFYQRAGVAAHRHTDKSFRGDTSGFLCRLGNPFFAQPIDGGFEFAAGFGQCGLAIHHACAGLFAQVLYHSGRDIRHDKIIPLFATGAMGRYKQIVMARNPAARLDRPCEP